MMLKIIRIVIAIVCSVILFLVVNSYIKSTISLNQTQVKQIIAEKNKIEPDKFVFKIAKMYGESRKIKEISLKLPMNLKKINLDVLNKVKNIDELNLEISPTIDIEIEKNLNIKNVTIIKKSNGCLRLEFLKKISVIHLNLRDVSSKDVDKLPPLPNLKALGIWFKNKNNIFDYNVLDNYPLLRSLSLTNVNQILHMGKSENINWENFYLDNSSIDVLPKDMICRNLWLSNMSVDVKSLPNSLYNSTHALYIRNSKIDNLALIKEFKNLNIAVLNGSNIDTLKYLKNLPLNSLNFANTGVNDISSLSNIKTLKVLNISYTKVENLKPLVGLNLDYLVINNTPAAKKPLPSGLKVKNLIKKFDNKSIGDIPKEIVQRGQAQQISKKSIEK